MHASDLEKVMLVLDILRSAFLRAWDYYCYFMQLLKNANNWTVHSNCICDLLILAMCVSVKEKFCSQKVCFSKADEYAANQKVHLKGTMQCHAYHKLPVKALARVLEFM